jgi:hypothetical protein
MNQSLPAFSQLKCIILYCALFFVHNSFAQTNPPQTFDNSRCGPGEITLTASGCTGGTLKWYNDALAGSVINIGNSYTLNVISTSSFYVSCTLNGVESTRSKITASAIPSPPGGGGQITGCGPSGVFLTATGCSQGIVKWYEAISQNSMLVKGALLHTGSVFNPQLTQSGTMFLATCTVNGCESAPSIFIASYYNIPLAPVTQNGSRCGPGEVTIQVTSPTAVPGKYSWYTQASGGTPFAQTFFLDPTFKTLKVNVTNTTSFWVSYTIDDGCESQRAEVKAIVNPLPDAPLVTGGSRPDAGAINLTASGCNGGVLNWYNAAVNGTIVNTGTTYSPFISTTTSYWVSCTLNGCESQRSEVIATISPCSSGNTGVSIPVAYALPKGVLPNSVYKGYTPASSITITAIPSGSNSPYQYLWSNGATTPSITVSPSTTQNYTVTIIDKNGCSAIATTTINVYDVSCSKSDKVLICKLPPGNTSKSQELCIAASAVNAHLATGSYLGSCLIPAISKNIAQNTKVIETLFSVSIHPNPAKSVFVIHSSTKNPAIINVYDVSGRLLEKISLIPGQKLTAGENYEPGVYYFEWVQGDQRKTLKAIKM